MLFSVQAPWPVGREESLLRMCRHELSRVVKDFSMVT